MTSMLIPLGGQLGRKIPFLIKSAMLTRSLVGVLRIIADTPAWNPNPVPKRDKIRNQLERVFIEVVGTMGGFFSLQICQDVTAKALEAFRPRLAPRALLEDLLKSGTPKPVLQAVENSLSHVFETKDLGTTRGSLFARVYGRATLSDFADHFAKTLQQPEWFRIEQGHGVGRLAPEVNRYFARINRAGSAVVATGLLVGAYLSGTVLQTLNDRWFRNGLEKRWADWILRREGESPMEEASAEVAPAPSFTPLRLPPTQALPRPIPALTSRLDIISAYGVNPVTPWGMNPQTSFSPACYPAAVPVRTLAPMTISPALTPRVGRWM
ncbi:MAG: hypothetical protein SFZ03_11370 [Candidatus Melainabacteria bacterium]|nr:hypothetical protein [Candidatus Melainabacteria bacterium]